MLDRSTMSNPVLAKKWKTIEIQLIQAYDFLLKSENFNLEQKELKNYQEFLRANELELAMIELAEIAYEHGANFGFWQTLQKAAKNMDLTDKVEEYKRALQDTLSKNE
jgi:hypothetical protein